MKNRRNDGASRFNRLVSFVLMLAISDVTMLVPLATVANAQPNQTARQVAQVDANPAISSLYSKNLEKVSQKCDRNAGKAIPGLVIQKLLNKKVEAAVAAEEAKRGRPFDRSSDEYGKFTTDLGMKLLPEVKKAVKKMGSDVPAEISEEVYANANDQLMQCYFNEARACSAKSDALSKDLATAAAKKSKYKGLTLAKDFIDPSGENYQYKFLDNVNGFLKSKGVNSAEGLSKYRELNAFLGAGSCYDAARRKFRLLGMGKGPKKENKCMDLQANGSDYYAADVGAGGQKAYPFRQANNKQVSCDLICDLAPSAKDPLTKEFHCDKQEFWDALAKNDPAKAWQLPKNYMSCDFSPQAYCEGGNFDPREFEKKMGQVSAQDELHRLHIAAKVQEGAEQKRQAQKFQGVVGKTFASVADKYIGDPDAVDVSAIPNMPLGSMDTKTVEQIHYNTVKDELAGNLVDFHDTMFLESYLQNAAVLYNGVDTAGYRDAIAKLEQELSSCSPSPRTQAARIKLDSLNKKLASALNNSKSIKVLKSLTGPLDKVLTTHAEGSPEQSVEQMANALACVSQLKKRFRKLEHELGSDFIDSIRPILKDEEIAGAVGGELEAAAIEVATNINPLTLTARLLLTRIPIAGDLDGANDQYCHPGKQYFQRGRGTGRPVTFDQEDSDGTTVSFSEGNLGSSNYCASVAKEYSFLGEQLHDLFAQYPELLADYNQEARLKRASEIMKTKKKSMDGAYDNIGFEAAMKQATREIGDKTLFEAIDNKHLSVIDESILNYKADFARHRSQAVCLMDGMPVPKNFDGKSVDAYTSVDCSNKGVCLRDPNDPSSLVFQNPVSKKQCEASGVTFIKLSAGPMVHTNDSVYNEDRTPKTCMDKLNGKKPDAALVAEIKKVLDRGREVNLVKGREGIKNAVCNMTPKETAAEVTKNSMMMKHFFDCKRPRFMKAAQNFGLYMPNSPTFQDSLSEEACANRVNSAPAACHMRADAQYDDHMTGRADKASQEFMVGLFDGVSILGAAGSGTQALFKASVGGTLTGGAMGGTLGWLATPSSEEMAAMTGKAKYAMAKFELGYGDFKEHLNSKKQLKDLAENDPKTQGVLKGVLYGMLFGNIHKLGPKAPKGLGIPKASIVKGADSIGGIPLKTVAEHVGDYQSWKQHTDKIMSNPQERALAQKQYVDLLNDSIKAKLGGLDVSKMGLSVEQRIRLLVDSDLDGLSPTQRLAAVMWDSKKDSDGGPANVLAKTQKDPIADQAHRTVQKADEAFGDLSELKLKQVEPVYEKIVETKSRGFFERMKERRADRKADKAYDLAAQDQVRLYQHEALAEAGLDNAKANASLEKYLRGRAKEIIKANPNSKVSAAQADKMVASMDAAKLKEVVEANIRDKFRASLGEKGWLAAEIDALSAADLAKVMADPELSNPARAKAELASFKSFEDVARPVDNVDQVTQDLKNTSLVSKVEEANALKENQTILVRDAEAAGGSRGVAADQDNWAPATVVREGSDVFAVYDKRMSDGSLKSTKRKLGKDELAAGNVRNADFSKMKNRLTNRYGKDTMKGLSEQDMVYLQWIDDWTTHYKDKAKVADKLAKDFNKGADRLAKSDPKKSQELRAQAKAKADEAANMRKLAQETDVKVKRALDDNKKRDPNAPCVTSR